jgi:hypothetical protein
VALRGTLPVSEGSETEFCTETNKFGKHPYMFSFNYDINIILSSLSRSPKYPLWRLSNKNKLYVFLITVIHVLFHSSRPPSFHLIFNEESTLWSCWLCKFPSLLLFLPFRSKYSQHIVLRRTQCNLTLTSLHDCIISGWHGIHNAQRNSFKRMRSEYKHVATGLNHTGYQTWLQQTSY